MFSTAQTKRDQLANGFFQTGSGPETLLIVGSCRTLSYLNYIERWNRENGDRYTICRIDPFDYAYDAEDRPLNLEKALEERQSDTRLLDLFRKVDVYVHEYFVHFGLFNSDRVAQTNVYQFGLNPRLDVCLPNWHDRFVLFTDQLRFDEKLRALWHAHGLTPELTQVLTANGICALEKFYHVCRLSSFPEMADFFVENWRATRLFWTGNHVTKDFTFYLFNRLNERFLHLPLSDAFRVEAGAEDQFGVPGSPRTPVTQADRDAYGISWSEPTEPLSIP